MPQLRSLADEGLQLRSSLYAWAEMARHWQASLATDNQMLIAWVFYAAISIYLSGTFDYSEAWTERGISTAALDQLEIQQHVKNILNTTAVSIQETNTSGLIFLFPLRIAGARAITAGERVQIRSLLTDITHRFRAANAFISDLDVMWANAASKCNRTMLE